MSKQELGLSALLAAGTACKVWSDIISALRIYGYDYVLSIEHEDPIMSVDEGLNRAITNLKSIMIKRRTIRNVVGVTRSIENECNQFCCHRLWRYGAYHVHNILPNENERIHIVGTYDISEERQAISTRKRA